MRTPDLPGKTGKTVGDAFNGSARAVPQDGAPAAYASPLRRLIAYLLDEFLAVVVINLAAGFAVRGLMALGVWGEHLRGPNTAAGEVGFDVVSMWTNMGSSAKLAVVLAFLISFGPLYFVLLESSPWQATIGKRWLRVYVTDDERRRIGAGLAAWRWIVKAVFPGILALLQLVVMAVSKRRKAIHDFAVRTVVLTGRPDRHLEWWRLPVAFGASAAWVAATFMMLL
jgi:uncharacterized RDD family membrane protein YckC